MQTCVPVGVALYCLERVVTYWPRCYGWYVSCSVKSGWCATGTLPHRCPSLYDWQAHFKFLTLKTKYRKERIRLPVQVFGGLYYVVSMDWGPLHFFSLFWWSFCYPKLVPVTLCSCVNRSTFWVGPDNQLFIPDICFWSEGALGPDGWWGLLPSCSVWGLEKWHSDMAIALHSGTQVFTLVSLVRKSVFITGDITDDIVVV